MGIDIGDLFGQAEAAVSNAWGDVSTTGVPAARSAIETWAATALTGLAASDQKTAQQGVQVIAQRPQEPGSLSSIFSSTFGKIGQTVAGQQYGLYIVGGIIALIFLGGAMRGK